jgi:DNA-binding response OmpR family regulator
MKHFTPDSAFAKGRAIAAGIKRPAQTIADIDVNALPLQRQQKRLLAIMLAKGGKCTHTGRLATALDTSKESVRVQVLRMRRELAGSGITIRTHWGGGYSAIREPAHVEA